MNNNVLATAAPYSAPDSAVDSYLIQVARQSDLSRKLWLYFSMVTMVSVGVFIAMQ